MIVMLRRCLITAAIALASIGSQAEAETRTVHGQRLALTSTLSSDLSVTIDPTLSGIMRISGEGASCLSLAEGETVAIGTAACGSDPGELLIAVPPATPVTLTTSGEGDVTIGDLHAPLVATLIGGGDLKIGAVRNLALSAHGSGDISVSAVDGTASLQLTGGGDVRLAALKGPLTVRHTGSGDLAVGSIHAASVELENSGSGNALIGGGSITTLRVRMVGSGDLAIAATVAGGDVSAMGGGDVKLGPVTGPLARSASGGSDIVVGGSAVVTGIIADIAKVIGESDGQSGKHGYTEHRMSDLTHLIMAVVLAVTLFLIWRIVRRRRRVMPDQPLHPGVLAVGETMSRLEQRLGRIESYVTTREFDLNQKFRDLK